MNARPSFRDAAAVLLVLSAAAQAAWASADPPPEGPQKQPGTKAAATKPKQPAAQESVLEGRVLDEAGQPVAGAKLAVAATRTGSIYCGGQAGQETTISVFSRDERSLLLFAKPNSKATGDAETDEQGRFTIKGLRHDTYNLLAYHQEKGIVVRPDVTFEAKSTSIDLVMERPTFIEGAITDLPVPKIGRGPFPVIPSYSLTPRELPAGITFRQTILLDADGRFRAGPLPNATEWRLTVQVFVERQEYQALLLDAPIKAEPGRTTAVEINLAKKSRIEGEVRGSKGEPLSGVSVVAEPGGDGGWIVGSVTDSDGRYVIAGLPDGPYTLKAQRWTKRTAPG